LAAMSSVEARGAACDHSVSRTSRRFEDRVRSIASRNAMRTSHARNRPRSRNRSNRRYARRSASCATSSASALLRRTPRATRYASGPHSLRRSSNSRRRAVWAASFANSFSAVRPGWIRTSSCIGSLMRAKTARPPRTPARRRSRSFGSRKLGLASVFNKSVKYSIIEKLKSHREFEFRSGTVVR